MEPILSITSMLKESLNITRMKFDFWLSLFIQTRWKFEHWKPTNQNIQQKKTLPRLILHISQLTKSCLSKWVIFSTIDHSHLLNLMSLSPLSPDSSLNDVYDIRTCTLISPTPFKSSLKSSAVRPSNDPSGRTSNTPVRML